MDSVDWKNAVNRVKRISIETYQAGKARTPRTRLPRTRRGVARL
jgi:hypothetical protein